MNKKIKYDDMCEVSFFILGTVRSKMYQGFDAAGEKVWGCSLCSYSHKEPLHFTTRDFITVPGTQLLMTLFFVEVTI
jgi:hypothetical protein